MTYTEDKEMLVIPRTDGLVVRTDDGLYIHRMTAQQMLELSNRCLTTGLEMLRERDRDGVFDER